ncbi:UPF0311 protein [Polymorphobacter glacialis]|uniref:UPF0311 protein GCM10011529_07820 n=1 Tax=Sandarakinorhabdus glacialis TaxID=1614636 RepID=A0A916ZLR6_9SPHN|nr:DUF3237 domain-containing protein [Polymorphobacter glacialis]GGE03798.1 UPF0311 protein [Polymorphobacter glacialis]
MNDDRAFASLPGLSGEFLATVDFEVGGGIMDLGRSPWGSRRVGYISGGRFLGPGLSGIVLPGGGNWSQLGVLENGDSVGTFDARAVWRTDDDSLIYLTYSGRSVVPDAVRRAFADPAAPVVDPALYYLRIAVVFETASSVHGWLNGVLAVGMGERTAAGVRHQLFKVS